MNLKVVEQLKEETKNDEKKRLILKLQEKK